ncbi:MAG: shikimate dehydrogenase, partial [Candidatus Levyibacteriota bacterium]
AYEALGLPYIFIPVEIDQEDIATVMKSIDIFNIQGISCTMPFKLSVMKYLDHIDVVAKKIGAVNSIVNRNGKLSGYNTDYIGVLNPLEKITRLKNKKVAIIGAGGAARAMIYAMKSANANISIFNRTLSHANKLAQEFDVTAKSFNHLFEIKDMDIILNAIPIDKKAKTHPAEKFIQKHHIVFDAVYVPLETHLLKIAKKKGAVVIPGMEMFLSQAVAQFKLFTEKNAPEKIMREILLRGLQK